LCGELNCKFQICVIMPSHARTRKIPRRYEMSPSCGVEVAVEVAVFATKEAEKEAVAVATSERAEDVAPSLHEEKE